MQLQQFHSHALELSPDIYSDQLGAYLNTVLSWRISFWEGRQCSHALCRLCSWATPTSSRTAHSAQMHLRHFQGDSSRTRGSPTHQDRTSLRSQKLLCPSTLSAREKPVGQAASIHCGDWSICQKTDLIRSEHVLACLRPAHPTSGPINISQVPLLTLYLIAFDHLVASRTLHVQVILQSDTNQQARSQQAVEDCVYLTEVASA